jgi:DNA-binding HxlR family transcriptional regulator
MATKLSARTEPPQSRDRRGEDVPGTHDEEAASGEDLLELLGDEYTRRVLQAVVDEPKSGSDVVEEASVSKATAYRRLETLQEAGLVTSKTVFDPDGHHHDQFEALLDGVTVELGEESVSADPHLDTPALADD